MPPTSFHWSRYRRRAATGLVAAVVAGLAVAGTAAPAAAVGTPSLIGASAVDAVAQQSADPAAQPRTHAGTARLPLVAADGDAASKVRPAGPDAANGFYCTGSLDYNIHGVEQDDYLEERVDVDYSAEVDCNFFVNRIQGRPASSTAPRTSTGRVSTMPSSASAPRSTSSRRTPGPAPAATGSTCGSTTEVAGSSRPSS